MTTARYIKWLKTDDTDFRADYATEVGESIADNIRRENSVETHYLISSYRITPTNETNLSASYTLEFEDVYDSEGEVRQFTGWVDL